MDLKPLPNCILMGRLLPREVQILYHSAGKLANIAIEIFSDLELTGSPVGAICNRDIASPAVAGQAKIPFRHSRVNRVRDGVGVSKRRFDLMHRAGRIAVRNRSHTRKRHVVL
ncbi:MAG TPA: hypothetical protein ENN79_15900 [Desulfobacteraceae bacterium]|nr:hypothetical protein [Desulfobacteraceae bacterium]